MSGSSVRKTQAQRDAEKKKNDKEEAEAKKKRQPGPNAMDEDKMVATPMGPSETYADYASDWRKRGNEKEFESEIKKMPEAGPSALSAYKIVWNGVLLRQEDVIKAVAYALGEDKVNYPLSVLSCVFPCGGTTGQEKGAKGGGCTLFVSKFTEVPMGQKIRYTFAADADGEQLVMEAEVWPDPLCGMTGTRMGTLSGDLYQKTFDPKRRNALLQIELHRVLQLPELKLAVKNMRDQDDKWHLAVFCSGSAQDKRDAMLKLRKGVDIEWEGWSKPVKITNGGSAEKKEKVEQSQKVQQRIFQELEDTDGRRIHVYKLRPDIVESEELQELFKSECEKFGKLAQEPGLRSSRDGCAFAWIIYSTVEQAELAMDDEALATALSTDALCSEKFGYVSTELVLAADARDRRAKQNGEIPVIDVDAQPLSKLARKSTKDADRLVAEMLMAQQTAAALVKQVVVPMLDGTEKLLRKEGKRIVTAMAAEYKAEMNVVLEAMKAQSKQIEQLTRQLAGSDLKAGKAEPASAARAKRKQPQTDVRRGKGKGGASVPDYKKLARKLMVTEGGADLMGGLMGADFVDTVRGGNQTMDWADRDSDESVEEGELSEY